MTTKAQIITVNDTEWKKPYPSVDHDNQEFWEGLKDHKLLVWKCTECGAVYLPKCYCQNHDNKPFAENCEWVEASGRGKIFAFNIHQWAFHPGFKEELPYIYALVELEEGPLISSTLVGGNQPIDVHNVGQDVEIVYEDHPNLGFTLPKFRVVSA
jgi:uncharacterized OB-fold protein